MTARGAVLGLLAALALATPARAGVQFELDTERASGGASEPLTVWVEGDRMALEGRRPDGPAVSRRIVFRAEEDVMWLLDARRRSYFQLDPESARQTAGQLQGLREGLESGLEALGPEQGARVRELLGGLGAAPTAPPPEVELRPQGRSEVYAELTCARMDVLSAGRRVAELCLADWGQGVLRRERLPALPALGSFLGRTLPPLMGAFPSLHALAPLLPLAETDAVPIHGRIFEAGGEPSVTRVRRVRELPLDPTLFEIPPGWARSWIPPFGG